MISLDDRTTGHVIPRDFPKTNKRSNIKIICQAAVYMHGEIPGVSALLKVISPTSCACLR